MRSIIFVLMAALPLSCFAQMYGPEYGQCSQDTTVNIVDCVGRQTKHWSVELDGAYKALMNNAEAQQQAPLKMAQRAWIKYRDANCVFYGSASGSLSQVEAAECLRTMTQARACELKAADQQEASPDQACASAVAAASAGSQASVGNAEAARDARPGSSAEPAAAPATLPPATMASSLEKREHTSRGTFSGYYNPTDKKSGYGADFRAYIQFADPVDSAGGTAVFGWVEASNEVVLLTYAKYLPSLSLAETQHRYPLRTPLMDLGALPRYVMQCLWETEDDKVAPALAAYAERNDANSQVRRSKVLDSLIATWVNVPAARAQKKFAAYDYCAEISRTGTTHARTFMGEKS